MGLKNSFILLFLLVFTLSFGRLAVAEGMPALDNSNRAAAEKMSSMYAAGIFHAHCTKFFSMNMGDEYRGGVLTTEMKKKLDSACGCYTKEIVGNVSSDSIIKFVMTMESNVLTKLKTPQNIEEYYRKNNMFKIVALVDNADLRKKCGFAR